MASAGSEFQDLAMDILGITIWREARGLGEAGMTGVYHVIMNRASDKRWPSDPEKVCLQPLQFSCWNTHDPQRLLYPQPQDVQYRQAQSIIQLDPPDTTQGANCYYDISIEPPSWATDDKLTTEIGNLRFYKL